MLSAKDDERLRDAVSALERQLDDRVDLADLAYTLMVGREEMEVRLAIVTSSAGELKHALTALIDGATTPANVWRSHLGGGDALAFLKDEEDAAALVGRWADAGKLDMVGRFWLAGGPVDWKRLPQAKGRRRVPLPLYPFARDRHWFEDRIATLEQAASVLQPTTAEVERVTAIMRPIDALDPFLRRALLHVIRRADLVEAAILPEHHKLFSALTALTGDAAEPIASHADLVAEKDRLIHENPAARPHLTLAWTCLERYPEILTGKVPATEVLFPNSSMELVEPVYRENPLADFTNRLAAAAVARHAEEIAAAHSRRAEIVEIGGGTGHHRGGLARHRSRRTRTAVRLHRYLPDLCPQCASAFWREVPLRGI